MDGMLKGIYPSELTMTNINAGITIPYYGPPTLMCMSCEMGIATTRLRKNCHVVHEHLELTIKAYQTPADKNEAQ